MARSKTTVTYVKDQQTALKPVNITMVVFGIERPVKNLVGREGQFVAVIENHEGKLVSHPVSGDQVIEVDWVVR